MRIPRNNLNLLLYISFTIICSRFWFKTAITSKLIIINYTLRKTASPPINILNLSLVRLTYATLIFLVFSFKCKEWGFLLKKLFGSHLGTGDYGYLVVDHSAMLLRHFRSFYKYSGQGFESSHKLHRQLYSKATNHDAPGPSQSCELINIYFDAHTIMKKCTY